MLFAICSLVHRRGFLIRCAILVITTISQLYRSVLKIIAGAIFKRIIFRRLFYYLVIFWTIIMVIINWTIIISFFFCRRLFSKTGGTETWGVVSVECFLQTEIRCNSSWGPTPFLYTLLTH